MNTTLTLVIAISRSGFVTIALCLILVIWQTGCGFLDLNKNKNPEIRAVMESPDTVYPSNLSSVHVEIKSQTLQAESSLTLGKVFIHESVKDSKFLRSRTYKKADLNLQKLLVQVKDSSQKVIQEYVVDHPGRFFGENFKEDGEVAGHERENLNQFNFKLVLANDPKADTVQVYEMSLEKSEVLQKLGEIKFKDILSKAQVIKASTDLQIHSKIITGVTAEVEKYLENGSPDKKINLVFVSDGFISSEMEVFRNAAITMVNSFFSDPQLIEKKNAFNIYFIKAPSPNSCIKQSTTDPCVSNLGSYFKTPTDRILYPITANVLDVVDTFLTNVPVSSRYVALVGNTPRYAGLSKVIIATGIDPDSIGQLYSHELGHLFGKLQDEYEYFYNTSADQEYQRTHCLARNDNQPGYGYGSTYGSNVSASPDPNKLHPVWQDLIKAGASGVDIIPGGGYCPSELGVRWRGCSTSKMRSISQPWCSLNIALLLHQIKEFVGEGFTLTVRAEGADNAVPIAGEPSAFGGLTDRVSNSFLKANIASGTLIVLTAPAEVGSAKFIKWNGCSSANGDEKKCNVIVSANRDVTAVFGPPTSVLTPTASPPTPAPTPTSVPHNPGPSPTATPTPSSVPGDEVPVISKTPESEQAQALMNLKILIKNSGGLNRDYPASGLSEGFVK